MKRKFLRRYFCGLTGLKLPVYLDSATTTLKLRRVFNAIGDYARHYLVSGNNPIAEQAINLRLKLAETQNTVQQFIGAPSATGISFFSNTTAALNQISANLQPTLNPGAKIALTAFEHSSNDAPWIRLARTQNAHVQIIKTNQMGLIDLNWLQTNLNHQTKIVTFAAANNTTGCQQPIHKICQVVRHQNPNAIIICDATQSVTQFKTDVQQWGVDCLVFSGHKMFASFGVAVMWVSQRLLPQLKPLVLGGRVVSKINDQTYSLVTTTNCWEGGTANYYAIASLKIAITWITTTGINFIAAHIQRLRQLFMRLWTIHLQPKVVIYNSDLPISSIILINVKGYHAHDVAAVLDRHGVIVRAGDFCAKRFLKQYQVTAMVRISLQVYNTKHDIYRLVRVLRTNRHFAPI